MYNLCRHIMPSGRRCNSPALRNRPCCYFHTNLRRSAAPKGKFDDLSLTLPPLEDARAVQIALTEVLSALASSRLDPRRAGLLLYGLQIAAQVTARPSQPETSDCVQEVCQENEEEVLAPEGTGCDPDTECPSCPSRDHCKNPKRIVSVREWLGIHDEEDEKDEDEDEDEGLYQLAPGLVTRPT